MPTLTGTIAEITGSPINPDSLHSVTVRAPSRRVSLAAPDRLVASVSVPVEVSAAGVLSVDLEPGPAVLLVEGDGLHDVYELGVTEDMTLLSEAVAETAPNRSWVESNMVQLRAAALAAAGLAELSKIAAGGAAADAVAARAHIDEIRDLLDEAAQTNVAPYLTQTELNATYGPRTAIPATRVRAWGHSFMAGVGPGMDSATQGMARLIATATGLPLSNKAVGGTVLADHLSAAAHWGVVLTEETRPTTFTPRGGFFPVMYGFNDLNYAPAQTVAGLATFKAALRTVISRLRAAAVFENNHASVALAGGTWQTTTSGQPTLSGGSFQYTNTVGATIKITTPDDFPGGTIALGFLQWNDGSGGTISGTVNGQTYSINTAATSRTTARTPAVLRIPNLPAGQATYTFTVTAANGAIGVGFDYWQWEPDEHLAPVVALLGQPKPLDYAGYGAGSAQGGPPSDAGVDALNTVQQQLAAEFGHRVLYVDNSAIDKDPAYWIAGNVHPNAAGHAHIAARVTDALAEAKVSFAAIDLAKIAGPTSTGGGTPAPAPALAWSDYTPTLSGTGTSPGNGSWQIAKYARDGDLIHFFARFLVGSTTVIGSRIEATLPTEMLSVASAVTLQAGSEKAGVGQFSHDLKAMTTTTVRLYTPGANGQLSVSSAAVPFTWAANDSFDVRGTYRALPG